MLQEQEATAVPEPEGGPSPGQFATTHWTMVVRAGKQDSKDGHRALGELCRVYWPPLYAFARREGATAADAEDMVQGFFADFLSRNGVAVAESARGRFRSYLLRSFRNFGSRQRRSQAAVKRGGGVTFIPLDVVTGFEETLGPELAAEESAERIYDRKWTERMLAQVFATVRREYASVNKDGVFDELCTALWGGGETTSYAEIGRRIGKTEGAIKIAVYRLRKRLGDELRRIVAETVEKPEDVETELQHLLASLGR